MGSPKKGWAAGNKRVDPSVEDNKHKNMEYRNDFPRPSAFDSTVKELCRKIDRLRAEVEFWQEKTEELQEELSESQRQHMSSVMDGVGNAIMFALSVKDDADGNLVISKENRKDLANHYRG